MLKNWKTPFVEIPVGKGICLKEGSSLAVLSLGDIGNTVTRAIELLGREGDKIAHYDMRFHKPLDEELLRTIGSKFTKIVTVENGSLKGGFGSAILEFFADNNYSSLHVKRLGLPDEFIEHGSNHDLYKMLKLDEEGISITLKTELKS